MTLLAALSITGCQSTQPKPPAPENFEHYAFDEFPDRVRTDAIVVVQDGSVIYERYARGYTAESKHISWSMAKTISAAIIGVAAKENLIKLDDTLDQFFTGLTPQKSKIKIRDLLNMASGIDFNESYDDGPVASDAVAMLYRDGQQNMPRFVLSLPQLLEPGTRFYYSSGDSNVTMGALHAAVAKKLSEDAYAQYPFEKFFAPLGIQNATFERDGSGNFASSSYAFLTARQYARVGELFLNHGQYQGHAFFSPEWFTFMTTLSPGFSGADPSDKKQPFGAQLWLNRSYPEKDITSPYPSIPEDALIFLGYSGQMVVIVPSEKLVVLRLADDRGRGIHRDYFLSLILRGLGKTFPTLHPLAYDQGEPNESDHAYRKLFRDPNTNLDQGGIAGEPSKRVGGTLFSMPGIGAAFAAKEYCSCHFVSGQSHDLCKESVYRGVPFFGFSVDEQKRTVKVSILFSNRSAHWVSPEFGCVLDSQN